jgi:hypothetical protein
MQRIKELAEFNGVEAVDAIPATLKNSPLTLFTITNVGGRYLWLLSPEQGTLYASDLSFTPLKSLVSAHMHTRMHTRITQCH